MNGPLDTSQPLKSFLYCTNVHPGESVDEILRNLKGPVLQVRNQIRARNHFSPGIWFSNQASLELSNESHFLSLKQCIEKNQMRLFTLNAFPYQNFHDHSVKHQVYKPDWSSKERFDYTVRMFSILEKFLMPGEEGGISTLPLGYGDLTLHSDLADRSAEHLAEIAAFLMKKEQETGKFMHLDLEPEPGCLLEDTKSVCRFFEKHLFTVGARKLKSVMTLSEDQAIDSLKRYIQLCYDICHFSVAFENHSQALKTFDQLGIQIGKFQVSNAIHMNSQNGRLENGHSIIDFCIPLSQDKYLHQTRVKSKNGIERFDDLTDAISKWEKTPPSGSVRIHYHVPIHWKTFGEAETTQHEIVELVRQYPKSTLWEVETYTWPSFYKDFKSEKLDIADEIAAEIDWLSDAFEHGF